MAQKKGLNKDLEQTSWSMGLRFEHQKILVKQTFPTDVLKKHLEQTNILNKHLDQTLKQILEQKSWNILLISIVYEFDLK